MRQISTTISLITVGRRRRVSEIRLVMMKMNNEHSHSTEHVSTATTYKNSSGDEIANVSFYAVRPEATGIRLNNAK